MGSNILNERTAFEKELTLLRDNFGDLWSNAYNNMLLKRSDGGQAFINSILEKETEVRQYKLSFEQISAEVFKNLDADVVDKIRLRISRFKDEYATIYNEYQGRLVGLL